jgi:hypothetical protein
VLSAPLDETRRREGAATASQQEHRRIRDQLVLASQSDEP